MKKLIIVLAVLGVFFAGSVMAGEYESHCEWLKATAIYQGTSGPVKFFILEFGKTKLKIYKCGQVEVMEWKEIVPNPDGNQYGTLYYNSSNR